MALLDQSFRLNKFASVDRFVKRKDGQSYGEYRTKRVIMEIYDEMKQAMETGAPYRTRLDPPPADAAVAHAPKERANIEI